MKHPMKTLTTLLLTLGLCALSLPAFSANESCDVSTDGAFNVVDIVQMVNAILGTQTVTCAGPGCDAAVADATSGMVSQAELDAAVAAVDITTDNQAAFDAGVASVTCGCVDDNATAAAFGAAFGISDCASAVATVFQADMNCDTDLTSWGAPGTLADVCCATCALVLDECGVAGGPGIADGACDCGGNVIDSNGVCGGDGPQQGLLDVCENDAQCTLGHCEPMTVGGQKRCTPPCTSVPGSLDADIMNAQCPRGTRCLSLNDGMYCLGDDVGRSCSGASSCNWDCLIVQGGPSYCTAPCAIGADCPNGFACNDGPGQKVCIRAEGHCTSGSECTQACDPNPPLLIGGCTALCTTAADCPQRAAPLTPWTCFGGYCLRPTDVIGTLEGGYSPTEYHCNNGQVANLCNDGLNTSFTSPTPPTPPSINCQSPPGQSVAGASDDSCANSCRYQGGCAYGFACVALGNMMTERIGLCLPTGAGEPGAACTNHTECVFGYCLDGQCSRDCTIDGICPGGLQCVDGGVPAVEGHVFKRCE